MAAGGSPEDSSGPPVVELPSPQLLRRRTMAAARPPRVYLDEFIILLGRFCILDWGGGSAGMQCPARWTRRVDVGLRVGCLTVPGGLEVSGLAGGRDHQSTTRFTPWSEGKGTESALRAAGMFPSGKNSKQITAMKPPRRWRGGEPPNRRQLWPWRRCRGINSKSDQLGDDKTHRAAHRGIGSLGFGERRIGFSAGTAGIITGLTWGVLILPLLAGAA